MSRHSYLQASAFLVVSLCASSLVAQDDDLEIPARRPSGEAPAATPAPTATPAAPAKPPAAEVEDQEDDLEVPSTETPPSPTPALETTPTASEATQNQDASAAQPGAVAATAESPDGSQTASDQATQTAAAETASEPSPAAPSQVDVAPTLRTGNLELTAHSRPVPLGLLFSGFVQAQYHQSQISEDQLQQDGLPLNRDQFSLRSARLRLDSGYEYTAFTLEFDATTLNRPNLSIRRAEGTLLYRGPNADKIPPLIGVSLGITDLPFGYELVESSRARVFMERTIGSEALYPTQTDIGVKLFGAFGFLRYAIALVNGEPVDENFLPRDPNAVKDIVSRFGADVPLGETLNVSGGASFGFGKGFHPGTIAIKDTITWDDVNGDNLIQPAELLGRPGAAARPSENFERWIVGLDLQFQFQTALGATQLFLEGYVASNHDRGLFVADPIQTGADVRHLGWYAAIAQPITRYGVVGFRAAYYDPNSDFLEARRGNIVPRSQSITTYSPVVGLVLPERARLLAQYDFVQDLIGRDISGVPTDAENDQFTLRLQVDL